MSCCPCRSSAAGPGHCTGRGPVGAASRSVLRASGGAGLQRPHCLSDPDRPRLLSAGSSVPPQTLVCVVVGQSSVARVEEGVSCFNRKQQQRHITETRSPDQPCRGCQGRGRVLGTQKQSAGTTWICMSPSVTETLTAAITRGLLGPAPP